MKNKKKSLAAAPKRSVWKSLMPVMSSFCLLLLFSCSEDEGEFDFPLEGNNLSIADISGNWNAFFVGFQDLELPDSQSQIVDFTAMGATATMNIENSGRFTFNLSLPGGSQETFSGQMGFLGDQLAILDDASSPGDEVFFGVDLSSDDIFTLSGVIELDFDEDGTIDETVLFLRMLRM